MPSAKNSSSAAIIIIAFGVSSFASISSLSVIGSAAIVSEGERASMMSIDPLRVSPTPPHSQPFTVTVRVCFAGTESAGIALHVTSTVLNVYVVSEPVGLYRDTSKSGIVWFALQLLSMLFPAGLTISTPETL